MILVIVLIAVILLLALAVVVLYNRLVRLRNRSENSWAQVDVRLRRRYDLIPNLVEAVKGYAAHERATFDEVTEARNPGPAGRRRRGQAQAENVLTAALGCLFAVAEGVPRAAGDRELPAAPGAACRRRAEHRSRARSTT